MFNTAPQTNPGRAIRTSRFKARQLLGPSLAALCVLLPQNALALDAVDFFKGLQIEAERDGNTLTWGDLRSFGRDGARATDIRIVDGETGDILTINKMELSGTRLFGNDGFSFENMTATSLRLISERKEGSTGSVSIDSLTASDFRLPPEDQREKEFWPFSMGDARLEAIRIVSSGEENVSLNIPSIKIEGFSGLDGSRFDLMSLLTEPATGSFAAENGANGAFNLGAISLSDLEHFGEAGFVLGAFDIGAFGLAGSDEDGQAVSLVFDGAKGTNVFTPDFAETGTIFPEGEMNVELKGASFRINGVEIVSLVNATSKASYEEADNTYAATAGINGLFINVEELPVKPGNEKGKLQFSQMGYDSISMDISLAANWNVASGLLDIARYEIDAKDMAVVDLNLKIGGYDEAFVTKLQSISNKIKASGDPEMQQALGFQLLGMLSGLDVVEISLSLEDDSLTNRILDVQARQTGQTAEDMAAALPFMAGAMLAEFEVPEFAASVASALNSFLKTSGKLTLSAMPENPISVAELMGITGGLNAGNVKPAEIIERFNVTVTGK